MPTINRSFEPGVNQSIMMKIDLEAQQLNEVLNILSEVVPTVAVWAFGSRVTGTARKHSDLDLAIMTSEPLLLSIMADLVEKFSESDLPFKVDIVDWSTTSEAFREIINKQKIIVKKTAQRTRH